MNNIKTDLYQKISTSIYDIDNNYNIFIDKIKKFNPFEIDIQKLLNINTKNNIPLKQQCTIIKSTNKVLCKIFEIKNIMLINNVLLDTKLFEKSEIQDNTIICYIKIHTLIDIQNNIDKILILYNEYKKIEKNIRSNHVNFLNKLWKEKNISPEEYKKFINNINQHIKTYDININKKIKERKSILLNI